MSTFKAYDIRGIYPTEIDEKFAYDIGRAFGTYKKGEIFVGRDVRLSSPALAKKVIDGLLSTGCDVIDLGVVTTPMVIFATAFYGSDAGIIITASHNPKEYNGFLFYGYKGLPIGSHSGLEQIKSIFESKIFSHNSHGSYKIKDIFADYANFILSKFKLQKKLKLVVDCGNGAASHIFPKILKNAGHDIVELNCIPDGNFPGRGPDPSKKEALSELMAKVLETNADLGLAYDADGDRLVIIDDAGNFIESRKLFYLLAKMTLLEQKSCKIVHDALTSDLVLDLIRQCGGIPILSRVGHTFVHEKLISEGANLGGELSGHYFFKEIFGADDVLFATFKVISFIAENNIEISSFLSDISGYPRQDLRLAVKEEKKFLFIDNIREQGIKDGLKIDTTDGVKFFLDGGWALVRASNTEPKIAISYEAKTIASLEKIKQFVDSIILRIPV